MSTPAEILDAVGDALQNDATLAGYVKNFFIGKRAQIVLFPVIAVQQISLSEKDLTFGTQDLRMSAGVYALIKVDNKDLQSVGDGTTKGILDVENDIKKALSADRTLGGKAIFTRISTTTYDESEYPVKGLAIELEIQFRQGTTTRT